MLSIIAQARFDVSELMRSYPPAFQHAYKQIVYEIACPSDSVHKGEVEFARWDSHNWKDCCGDSTGLVIEARDGVFMYPPPSDQQIHWHLNFADPDLFAFYAGRLLAQDELQVAEHPILAALRSALIASGIDPMTVAGRIPTPCTITGAPRRCRIDTEPRPEDGRPNGLYGNRFTDATAEDIQRATTPVNPPTPSNILAIAAPSYGRGCYSDGDISFILSTLVTGFSAAIQEARRRQPNSEVVLHTGFWGCGAFGGNRVLTPALQILAAHWTGLTNMVFYAFDDNGHRQFDAARLVASKLLDVYRAKSSVDATIRDAISLGMEWGVSDGN